MKIPFILGMLIGALFAYGSQNNLIWIALSFQLVSGLIFYVYGQSPKRYHLAPRLVIGTLTEGQIKENKNTELWSLIGICLFTLGQTFLIISVVY